VEPVIVPSLRETFAFSDSTKAVIVCDAPQAAQTAADMAALLGTRAYVTRSLPEFVEILSPAVNKGDALRFIAAAPRRRDG
jgi:hydroxymethylpyrimidine pyrophosphatase-like HAD family hydrolase